MGHISHTEHTHGHIHPEHTHMDTFTRSTHTWTHSPGTHTHGHIHAEYTHMDTFTQSTHMEHISHTQHTCSTHTLSIRTQSNAHGVYIKHTPTYIYQTQDMWHTQHMMAHAYGTTSTLTRYTHYTTVNFNEIL